VSTAANKLEGKPLHMMLVCCSVKHITRVDTDTMAALKLAAGIAGDHNVDKLVVLWTQAETPELKEKANACMEAVRESIVDIYEKSTRPKQKEKIKALYDLSKDGKLKSCIVCKGDVSALKPLVEAYGFKPPQDIQPEQWAKDPDDVDEEMGGFLRFVQEVYEVVKHVFEKIFPFF